MNRSVFPLVLVICLFVTIFSCSNKPKRSRKPVSVITVSPAKKQYLHGDQVSVNVKTRLKNGSIERIQLYYESELLKETTDLDFTIDGVTLKSMGIQNFRVVATKTDEVSNSRIKTTTVVSNTAPENLTYQTVNNFPHLKSSYTQGLEFHDGFLYEGTGNLGQSKLLKINLLSGNPVLSHNLADHYFGEGITILNNKIYQLTYKAQKGFIYDLHSFALIDSFQYKSKQGWGLANDGKNLIMSDGSHKLTWLDPNDFSIIKTVQVANHLGIVNNINELEYIDETIYANVYTTDLIVQIDPETGKVLSQVNLQGILNMYRNPSDTIDYLNGIAYDKEADRLFVTGKLWPKLFEIKLVSLE